MYYLLLDLRNLTGFFEKFFTKIKNKISVFLVKYSELDGKPVQNN